MISLPGYFAAYFGTDVVHATFTARTPSGAIPVGRVYVTVGGERLDHIAQVAYGFQLGAVEALLIWNHGLGDLDVEIPANVAIALPELATPSTKRASREVALWG